LSEQTKLIIRTSDRNQFRSCRVAWDFGSKIRLNYEPTTTSDPLEFGSAMHEGWQVLYDPKRWKDPDRLLVLIEAHAAFMRWMVKWQKKLKTTNQWDLRKTDYEEHVKLGKGVLDHYVVWVADKNRDKDWEPVFTEIEFEIPIPVEPENQKYVDARANFVALPIATNGKVGKTRYLHMYVDGDAVPVYYQGRIDLIILDLSTGKYWIIDHKTAKQFGSTLWFDMDTQTRSYGWAAKKVLKIDIEGVMFNRARKALPQLPKVNLNGSLSKNKQQKTTLAVYRAELKRRGLNAVHYTDFLSSYQEAVFFERLTSVHSDQAFEQTERAILQEAMDMLDDPFIYPNPGMFQCGYCSFRPACQALHDGQDPLWVLDHSRGYVNRSQEVVEVK
jgi:hypothetical protein